MCFSGHFGDLCQKPLDEYFPNGWLPARILLGIGYFLLFALGALIFMKIVRRGELHKPKNKIALHVLGSFVLYDLWTSLLYFVDPIGGIIFPMPFIACYTAFAVTMGFYFLGAILNYWIQVFHFTKVRLEREQKLMKINSNYNPTVTIEDIEDMLSRVNKWRIPYVIILVIIVLYQIPSVIVTSLQLQSYLLVIVGNLILNIVFYLLLCIAFFVYEKKILSLLDKRETKEVTLVRSVSLRVRGFCIISLCSIILITAYYLVFTGPAYTFAMRVLSSVQQWVVTIMIFSIYIDLRPSKLMFSLGGLFTDVTDDTDSNTLGMTTQSGHFSATDATNEMSEVEV
jgi:hypothetical protein